MGLGNQIRELVEGRWLAAAVAVACLAVVVATLLARHHTSRPNQRAPSSAQNIQQHAPNPLLRSGSNETPAPLAFVPLAIAPASPDRFIWPADYPLVQGMWAGHPLGIDIGTPYGQGVKAVRDGHVIFAGGDVCCNYGLFVIVEHADGWSSLYGHFSRIDVKFGDPVRQGQALGLSGQTGHADGPHVHFELHLNGALVDPLDYLEPHRDWAPSADLLVELEHPTDGVPAGGQPAASPEGPAIAAANAPPDAAPAGGLDGSTATLLGANWLAHQDDSAYEIEVMSCAAAQSGPNWWVTCDGQLQGCSGHACLAQLSACVFDQPRLVAAACP